MVRDAGRDSMRSCTADCFVILAALSVLALADVLHLLHLVCTQPDFVGVKKQIFAAE